MLFGRIATNSHPSSPASFSTSTSSPLADTWLSAIFRYSHSVTVHLPNDLGSPDCFVSRIAERQALVIVGQDLDAKDLACRSAALRSSIRELRRSASAARMIRYFPHREQPMTSPS